MHLLSSAGRFHGVGAYTARYCGSSEPAGNLRRPARSKHLALPIQALALPLPLTSGSAVASDAFFPFADGVEALADAGAAAVIQPGGSMRDAEVIAAADARGLAMVFTGQRHFRH